MVNAHKLEASHKTELPDSKGLVPLEEEDVDNLDAFRLNPFGDGLTTQEVGLSQCQEEENETSRARNFTYRLSSLLLKLRRPRPSQRQEHLFCCI
jgi:hypothetical protein